MTRDRWCDARTQGVPICGHIGATEDAAARRLAPASYALPDVVSRAEGSASSVQEAPGIGLPPGPASPPLVQALDWVRRPLPLLEECQRRFGDVFTLRLAGTPPIVLLSDPGPIRE